ISYESIANREEQQMHFKKWDNIKSPRITCTPAKRN
ncbi:unnamed protein product, partial [Rotaria magnacalcarata]